MKTTQKWMMTAAAAVLTLAFANCSGPAYYDDDGVPHYTNSYYTEGNGQIYYNTLPVDAYIGHDGHYGAATASSKEYYYRGKYHRGDFRLRNHWADSFR